MSEATERLLDEKLKAIELLLDEKLATMQLIKRRRTLVTLVMS